MADLSVIIVNYNTADLLADCLRSVLDQTDDATEVWVVDNASSDQSVAMVRERFPQVRLIASPENLGFAKANNLALRQATGRFIHFLNPDTVVQSGCYQAMLDFMATHPRVGMAGTRLLYPDLSPQGSMEERYPGQRYTSGELDGLPGNIAWLLGASIIARREVMEQVDGFSESYFLYGEDIDLGLKVRRAGWELGFIPKAMVIHWEGQSERGNQPNAVLRKKLAAEALFYKCHYRPDTIGRICRANILQARWRLLSLPMERLFASNKGTVAAKQERYRMILSFFLALAAETSSS
ncbi:MAG: glycosyltransferase family 2 protein [Thermodesulfobacteriota bacterium]